MSFKLDLVNLVKYLGLLERTLKLNNKTNLHVKPPFQILPYAFSKKGTIYEIGNLHE